MSDFHGTGTNCSQLERPTGKKKAKLAHQEATKNDVWRLQVARAQEKLAVELERHNQILDNDSQSLRLIAESGETNTQLSIMTHDLSGMDEQQQEFFRLKRSAILENLRSTRRTNPAPQGDSTSS